MISRGSTMLRSRSWAAGTRRDRDRHLLQVLFALRRSNDDLFDGESAWLLLGWNRCCSKQAERRA